MCSRNIDDIDTHQIKQKLKKIHFRLKNPKYAEGPIRDAVLAEQVALRSQLREVLELANPQESPVEQSTATQA